MVSNIKRVSFEITGKCNLHCFYCCRGYLNKKEKIDTEISTTEIIKIIRDARKKKCTSFLFTGGEPFVKKDFNLILQECSGCFVEVYSNGTLIAKKKNIELINKYITKLTVTIDGLESHDFYRTNSNSIKILKNIKKIKKNCDVLIKINTLLNKKSIDDLLCLYKKLKDVGVDEWHIDFPQLRGRLAAYKGHFAADYSKIGIALRKVIIEYYKDKKPFYFKIYKVFNSKLNKNTAYSININENPCSYKIDKCIFITSDKKYILCPSIPSQDIIIGKVDLNSYNDILIKKTKLDFNKIKYSDLKECINCRYFKLCLGGCRGEAKVLSNSFIKPDLNACSLMHISEKEIYPFLPNNISSFYIKSIDFSKRHPKWLNNLDELKTKTQLKYNDSK
ncbi:MAG TPA: radical SAM protein [archaeon]|nr:radical SAM protein [archaeon]